MSKTLTIQDFESWIFEFRGKKVMLDSDLAALYETETKKLKQQVKRNPDRFPEDFMFELTKEEKEQLIANNSRLENLKYSPINPLVFTEQGVSMLSSVLTSQKAIQVNIGIMRVFATYRALLNENKELKQQMQALDAKLNQAFQYLMDKIDALQGGKFKHIPIEGFKRKKK